MGEEKNDILRAIADLKANFNEKIDKLDRKLENAVIINKELEVKIEQQNDKIEKLERIVRRKNMIIFNFREENKENLLSKLLTFVNSDLKVPLQETEIDFAHRMGKPVEDKIRPIIVGLTTLTKKKKIFQAKRKLVDSDIFIKDDLTDIEREKRAKLYEKVKQLKEDGKENVKIRYDKIYVNGNLYKETDKETETEDEFGKRGRSPGKANEITNEDKRSRKMYTKSNKRKDSVGSNKSDNLETAGC